MIARRSRPVLARLKGNLKKPALPAFTKFSTSAHQHQAASPENAPSQGPSARLPLTLQSIYYQPLRRTPTLGLPVCDLQLRSYLVRNLEFMCDFALRAAYYCNLPASGPVPLPKKTERWTVPRGHFVHKKSQENFERVTHKRLIQIKDGHPETVELWLAFLRKHQYHGVGMKANVWGFDELGVGKRMNVSLETLKDVPRPKWTHFGSRRSFETAEKVREILASDGYRLLAAEPGQVDAALTQITANEAVQAKIKEILESPKYKELAEEPEAAVPLEVGREAVNEPVEASSETLPEGALATLEDVTPWGPEAAPDRNFAEATKEEALAETLETTPEVETELLSAEPVEQPTFDQAPAEAAPRDSVLTQAPAETITPEPLPTEPVQLSTPEQAPAGAAPEGPQAPVQPVEVATPEATPIEAKALPTESIGQPTPGQAPVAAAPEDSVLTQAPVQPAEATTPEATPVEAKALAFEPTEQPTPEQASIEAVSEEVPVQPAEEATLKQALIEATASDSAQTEPVEQASTTLKPTPVEAAPEEPALTEAPTEQLTPEQTPAQVASEETVLTNAPIEPVEQLTPEHFEVTPEVLVLTNTSAESAEQLTSKQTLAQVASEETILTNAPIEPVEQLTPEPFEATPEELVLTNTSAESAEQLTSEQTPVEAAPGDSAPTQEPELTSSQRTPEESMQTNPLEEGSEATALSPVATETEAEPVDTLEAEPVEAREQTDEVQKLVEGNTPVEATEDGQEKKE